MKALANRLAYRCGVVLFIAMMVGNAHAQSASVPRHSDDGSVEAKIQNLSASLDETRQELAESREEIRQLRLLLEQVSQKLDSRSGTGRDAGEFLEETAGGQGAPGDQAAAPSSEAPAAITQDDWEILNSRLEQQRQVKVESGSKFPLRLSGMFLLNTIINSGRVDNFDLATVALTNASAFGSTGFSLRQTVVGLEGNGPRIFHAETSADVQADFFGGTASGYGASASGLMRLRLARMRMDWHRTFVVGGLDNPFFSPNSPSSYLTVAEPGFSEAGNLWAWTPQIRIEQRFDMKSSQFRAEAGILAVPSYVPSLSGKRLPSPGEASRQPAYALRLSANGRDDSHPFSLGIAGVYLRQRFPGPATITGSGGMVDWNVPVSAWLQLTGEMFAGKGLDGFGAAPAPIVTQTDYTEYITQTAAALARIPTFGGWSQFKFRIDSRSEINLGVGGVSRNTGDFRQAAQGDPILQSLAFKNGSLVINYIFRPRSDLVFSAEYRRLRTYQISGSRVDAGQTGLSAGFLF